MAKLEGKVAFVTGASQGIGEGIARVCAKHGARVALADVSARVEDVAADLREAGHEAVAFVLDVTDSAALASAVARTVETFGSLDVLCANAGVCRLGDFLSMTDADRDFHIDVNIKGVWNTARAALPVMVEQGGGSVVITSSVTGDLVADPGECAYALSKAALVGLTKALAVEFAARNIRVNCFQPGYVVTPMAESIAQQSNPDDPESVLTEMAKAIPMRRLARPEEVGELAAFLGSDESSYITGSQFVIDGGSTLPESVSVGV
ncbi:MAG: Oxidoreductase UcpA [Paraeggerthella hongkongensis]|uniref:SDR family oxidoreductase UcpA n=1 Tax=Paraeggerthella TaxID=651554 RepID=UPI001C10635A|nr:MULTISPECIES: SDR family oxidoreductase UcpA [Paraeggerthella]MBU5404921.1 SDR family oxidoreductase UcpA [Paraeggerthella hongkongensis]MCD2433091.1 SDR family oxidoreductase UcpA [Paraeggerthella hominis]MDY3980242.1 SDR family oxidoreductase UcpA [Paraeggerthella sp.]